MWGSQAVRAIATQRRRLSDHTHGLERFALRMALVDLAGSVARWAIGLHDGLSKAGHVEAAAVFALGPPFPATDPTTDDCDQLGEYVEARMEELQELLAADGA
jgi:hypothetical protein